MRLRKPAPTRKPTLKDKKREETRRRLIAAAKELFSLYSYDDVSVTEIAKEAGVTHSMINVYFGGKPGLLYEIVRENNEPQYLESRQIAEQDRPALDRLSDILLLWVRSDIEDPRLLSIMQSYSWVWPEETEVENAADRARFKLLLADVIEQGIQSGEMRGTIDAELSAQTVFAVFTWCLREVVFYDVTADQCHQKIMDQVRQHLLQ